MNEADTRAVTAIPELRRATEKSVLGRLAFFLIQGGDFACRNRWETRQRPLFEWALTPNLEVIYLL
jgi:hypothetical protein